MTVNFNMTQNTRYALSLVSLLFIVTAGYSGYVIYLNKHNHDGSRFSLVNLISGRGYKTLPLKDSAVAKQTSRQLAQYHAAEPAIASATLQENGQREVVAGFLDEYLAGKNSNMNTAPVISKYGTPGLSAQYRGLAADTDLVLCSERGTYSNATIVGKVFSDSASSYFNAELTNSQQRTSHVQVRVVTQGGAAKIDKIFCPGTI